MAAAANGCFVAGTTVATGDGSPTQIELIRVGDRVQTASGQSESQVDESWRTVTFEVVAADGSSTIQLTLLRPSDWLTDHGVDGPGSQMWFDVEEVGIRGWGNVRSIGIAPRVADGPGRVVLATFNHVNNDVYELGFEGSNVALRPTGVHPFYSLDRNDWVAVRNVVVGETLQTRDGNVRVRTIRRISGAHRVFNLEVESDHEYLVSSLWLRTHNTCWLDKALKAMGRGRADIPSWMTNPHGHHIIPKKMDGPGALLRDLAERNGMTDVFNDARNLAVAPNGMGTHRFKVLGEVYNRLNAFDGDSAGFFGELSNIRDEMFDGTFYRSIGTLD